MIPQNTLSKSITLCLAMTLACAAAEKGATAPTNSVTDEVARQIKEQKAEAKDLFPTRGESLSFADRLTQDWADQYQSIRWRLLDKGSRAWELGEKIRTETFREAALIHPKDRDPVDVVLRQTEALAASLPPAVIAPLAKELASLASEIRAGAPDASELIFFSEPKGPYVIPYMLPEVPMATPRYAQYLSLCRLQRRIALANPLLDFNDILCARRGVPMGHHAGYQPHCRQDFPNYGTNSVVSVSRNSRWEEEKKIARNDKKKPAFFRKSKELTTTSSRNNLIAFVVKYRQGRSFKGNQMYLAPRIVADKSIRFGKPVVEGTRISVDLILSKLAGGMTYEEVMREYAVERADILAVLHYASKRLAEEGIRAAECSV